MKASNKVILNTFILYGKMIITMILSLLSTRYILQALGTEDFGIYNLVAGIIAMFSFLNVAMSAASQRFMSFAIGKNDLLTLKDTFYYSILLHLVIALLIVFLLEIGGVFFINNVLQIPENKHSIAIFVLHCLAINSCFTIISVPYQAIINARENMIVLALVNIIESALKLGIGFFLLWNHTINKLKCYSLLMLMVSVLSFFILFLYTTNHYNETKINSIKIQNKILFKSIFSFAAWNLIGSLSSMLRNQGIAILLNTFYGVLINAAYGIANQVNGQLAFFSNTIVRAIRPQIVKSEGKGDRERMLKLSFTTCKFSTLMLAFIVIPLILEMSFVLKIWLKNVPTYTVSFCKLILITSLIQQLSIGVSIAIESVGKIRNIQLVIGMLHFIVLPIGYILLKLGYNASMILLIVIIEESLSVFLRIQFAHRLTGLNTKIFYNEVLIRLVLVIISTFCIGYSISYVITNELLELVAVVSFTSITLPTLAFFYILNDSERDIILKNFNLLKNKYIN